jgi:hypothetical protein
VGAVDRLSGDTLGRRLARRPPLRLTTSPWVWIAAKQYRHSHSVAPGHTNSTKASRTDCTDRPSRTRPCCSCRPAQNGARGARLACRVYKPRLVRWRDGSNRPTGHAGHGRRGRADTS